MSWLGAVLERLLDALRLDDLVACTAQRQYTRELMLSALVQLMSEVVLGVHPTVHAASCGQKTQTHCSRSVYG